MMLKAAAIVLAAGLSTAAVSATPAASQSALKSARAEMKGPNAKMGPVLNALYKAQTAKAPATSARSVATVKKVGRLQKLLRATDGTVPIDISLKDNAADSRAAFEAYGLTNVSTYENHIAGRVPIAALPTIARNASVLTMRPALSRPRAGITQTQGDKAMRTDEVRKAFGLTGAGVKIGVLSDSFNCTFAPLVNDPEARFTTAAQDVRNGDLPRVQVLKDAQGTDCTEFGTDEGRAMLQLIHDVAPGSSLAFHTANDTQTAFAEGIIKLANAGARIIVDDVIYFAEPMFQDGIIAQAVDAVKARGVTYFSSAGNDARQSYESAFRHSGVLGILGGERHNFGTRQHPDTLQEATLDPDSITQMSFQWDEPFLEVTGTVGSRSDVDVIFYDTNGDLIPLCDLNLEPAVCQFPGINFNIDVDPYEEPVILNSSDSSVVVNVAIELENGPAPGRLKYVWFDLGNGLFNLNEYVTDSPTAYGHANAAGAEAVGAAPWYNTSEWGNPLWGNRCRPACLEYFSSAGGVPILFDKKGRRLSGPIVRHKPGITGPDGSNTSFFVARITDPKVGGGEPDQYPNFFGTSASAPHVAAVAALMLEQMKRNDRKPGLDIPKKRVPDVLITALRSTALDVRKRAGRTIAPYPIERPNGFDFDSGFGYVDAVKALTLVRVLRLSTD